VLTVSAAGSTDSMSYAPTGGWPDRPQPYIMTAALEQAGIRSASSCRSKRYVYLTNTVSVYGR